MAEEATNPPAQSTPDAGNEIKTPVQPAPEVKTPEAPPAGEAQKSLATDGVAADVKPEDKPKDEPSKEADVIPESYDLKLPENSPLKAQALEEIAHVAKEHKLTQRQAEALVERESKALASFHQAQLDDLAVKSQGWVQDVKTDKEIGGEGFIKNVELASRVVKRFGTESFQKMINSSGAGNHPEIVRIFARIGQAMSEDQLVIPGSQSGSGERTMEDIFYGERNKK